MKSVKGIEKGKGNFLLHISWLMTHVSRSLLTFETSFEGHIFVCMRYELFSRSFQAINFCDFGFCARR